MFVRHETRPGYRPTQLPGGTIEGEEAHLVPFALRAAGKSTLVLEEERPTERQVRLLDGQSVDLEAYLKGSPKIPGPVATQLHRAGAIQAALHTLAADHRLARSHLEDSARRMNHLRENLGSIEKNPTAQALRIGLTQQLTQATRDNEELEKRIAKINAESDEKRAQLRTLLEELTMEDPGP
jgi:hypothetical protein